LTNEHGAQIIALPERDANVLPRAA